MGISGNLKTGSRKWPIIKWRIKVITMKQMSFLLWFNSTRSIKKKQKRAKVETLKWINNTRYRKKQKQTYIKKFQTLINFWVSHFPISWLQFLLNTFYPINCCSQRFTHYHKNYLTVVQKFPQSSILLNYFLSACELFNEQENFDHDFALNLRPYGGLLELTTHL